MMSRQCHLARLIFVVLSLLFPVLATSAQTSELLEIGGSAKTPNLKTAPAQIKIVSYNIRWRSGAELGEISQRLKSDAGIGGAAIIGLQESDRNKERSHHTNTARLLAEELGMNYAWAVPPAAKDSQEEETGVAILSAYPLSNVTRLVLPHEGPGKRRRGALGATVKIGELTIRVYSVHAETRIPITKKMDQLRAVLNDLAQYPKTMPAIVLGDFNTWEVSALDETAKLFKAEGFVTPFPNDELTFRTRVVVTIELKLDWIWLRGLPSESYGIDRSIEVSDHWPLWALVKIK